MNSLTLINFLRKIKMAWSRGLMVALKTVISENIKVKTCLLIYKHKNQYMIKIYTRRLLDNI